MKSIQGLVGVFVSIILIGPPEVRGNAGVQADREAVANASRAWFDAFNQRDIPTYASFLDDAYLGTDDEGTLWTKEGVVRFAASRKPAYVQRKDRREEQVRIDGDVALVSYLFTDVHEWGAATTRFFLRRTEVLRKKNGKWFVVAAHNSRLPRNCFPSLETDPKTLGEYVGVYEWPRQETSDRDRYTLESGRLMSEWRGEKKEYFRMGPDTFFARDDSGWVTFQRDAAGRVTGYVYYYSDGQPVPVRKIE